MQTYELVLILVLLVGAGLAILTFFTSYRQRSKIASSVVTRGLNGVAGQTLQLQCPAGSVISLKEASTPRAVYVCSNPTSSNFESPSCDPYYQGSNGQFSSYFNPATTIDVSSTVSAACAGKNSCSWTVPSSSSSDVATICNGMSCAGEIQLIGTYDCVPQ